MAQIGKNDVPLAHAPSRLRAFSYPPDHAAMALWLAPGTGVLTRIAANLTQVKAHAGRSVVLLPYAQLLPLASRLWSQAYPEGFAPRFETTSNWSAALGAPEPGVADITGDMALDMLTAQSLLVQAGMSAQQETLAGMLVQAAKQLAPLAAAVGPAQRPQWASAARGHATLGMDSAALAWEARVALIAVEWAAASAYATDVLFEPRAQAGVDAVVVVQGLAPDPVAAGLQAHWGERMVLMPLAAPDESMAPLTRDMQLALHACSDAEDEAQRAVACALQHIAQDRYPLALVSSDRALTRRMRAMLESCGVAMRDENGWKLSTSLAGAQLMALLRACAWNASSDDVLAWLKCAPTYASHCDALEAALRTDQVRDWRYAAQAPHVVKDTALLAQVQAINTLRSCSKGKRRLPQWLDILQDSLRTCGMWDVLQADAAGAQVLQSVRLDVQAESRWAAVLDSALWATQGMDWAALTAWVNQALEGVSFQPPYPAQEQVVILPMSQMLGRPFAAVVLVGCDEVRLPVSIEPPGGWTAAQRAALGMPAREALEAAHRAAWTYALQTPYADVLWRRSDDTGEALLPSPLVQILQSQVGAQAKGVVHCEVAVDPREERHVTGIPQVAPLPVGAQLPRSTLSASAYEDLRHCPYRFFALRQLDLHPADELESEVDKRDFGDWLHAVLHRFHQAEIGVPLSDAQVRSAHLDACAAATTQAKGLPEGEFLPFAAAWPVVRDGYLKWLVDHEATGATYAQGEMEATQPLGAVTLKGRLDRVDHLADGQRMVLDYKTESLAKSKDRVKQPQEDTQMAFYAALLADDTLRAGYVNVGERDGTTLCEQKQIGAARDALVAGIVHDMQGIRDGAPLPALGEGMACDFCHARGLCRKDFWSEI